MTSDNKKPPLDADVIEALARYGSSQAPDAETASRIREQLFHRVHAPVADYLFVHSHQGEWVNLLQGVDLKLLREDAGVRSYLVRMAPGARIPPHEHPLDEESLVLEGEVTVNGVLCYPGDYHFAPGGKAHDWITSESGCLLFIRGAAAPRLPR